MKYFAKVGIISLVALAACNTPVRFPPEPYIEFVEYRILPPTDTRPFPALEVEMYFRDGDGDIGLEPGDTLPPFCDTCDYFNNLFVEVFSKIDGEFSVSFEENSRIRDITPVGQNKTLEGTLQYRVNLNNRSSDTLLVEMRLVDRALNESNLETTPEIYVGN
ncbi:MAG: hypothetical protein LAT76_03170 [Schleiferiaceae bacterium]|nr:hypothetical protein [Schleiferiaceae bacterium]